MNIKTYEFGDELDSEEAVEIVKEEIPKEGYAMIFVQYEDNNFTLFKGTKDEIEQEMMNLLESMYEHNEMLTFKDGKAVEWHIRLDG